MKKIGRLLIILCALTASLHAQNVELSARCSRTTVGLNEPFRITFATNARRGNIQPPNFNDFIIVGGPYSSSQTQIINGRMSSNRSLSYEVVAQKEGEFVLPPASIKVNGETVTSNRLKITVKTGAKRNKGKATQQGEPFSIDILSSKRSVYVGEPLILKFRATLYDQVRDLSIVQAPNFENVLQEKLDFKQESKREVVGNKIATLLDFDKRLILPNKPGTLGGQELKISAQVQVPTGRRDFFNMPIVKYVPQVATAKIPAVKIKPLPAGAPSSFNGGVGNLELVRKISRREVNGDESITITLRVQGTGNFNTIDLPKLSPPEGFDVYDPKYNEKIAYSERGIQGYKEYEYLLVPQYKGNFILPAIEWSYFDPKSSSYETISIPEDTLTVVSGAVAASSVETTSSLTPQKREVRTLDDDIRYLQDSEFSASKKSNRWLWWSLLALVTGILWVGQFISFAFRKSGTNWKNDLQKQVVLSFTSDAKDRYGVMINAIEYALVQQGLDLENITLPTLQEVYSADNSEKILALIEQCNLAQYAPAAVANDEINLNEFTSLWEMM